MSQLPQYLQSAVSDRVISLAQAIRLQQVLTNPSPNSRSELDPEIRQMALLLHLYLSPNQERKITDSPGTCRGCCIWKRRKLNRLARLPGQRRRRHPGRR